MYNKVQLIALIKKRKKWDIAYNTFFFWQKKGYIKTKNKTLYIGRTIPMYDENDYNEIVSTLERLNNEGKIRLQILT